MITSLNLNLVIKKNLIIISKRLQLLFILVEYTTSFHIYHHLLLETMILKGLVVLITQNIIHK